MYIRTYIHTYYKNAYIHTQNIIHLNLYNIHNNNNKNRLDADFVNSILHNTSNRTMYMQPNLSASGRVPSTEDMLPTWMATESLWSR